MTVEKIFYWLAWVFFRVFFTVYNRLSIKWLEPLPSDGNVIVACNHCSNLDPLVAGVAFPRRLRYFAKEELFRPLLFGSAIRILGAVPVSRADNAAAAGALRGFLKLLKEGNDVLIFPEGSRSPDGTLQPLEGGAGLIAAHAKASILPVFLKGTYRAMKPGAVLVRPAKISVTFGKLLVFDPEICTEKGAREKIMAELTKSLHELESAAS
ncbi:MAG: 1-acyl-sn-glycerol-3-phosphate acyltransferase [Synergistaceae bacterium]|nr:1-acyl-sn-glycerol-3-phosphate acyltransferase [Synergistaceae bacterium]